MQQQGQAGHVADKSGKCILGQMGIENTRTWSDTWVGGLLVYMGWI